MPNMTLFYDVDITNIIIPVSDVYRIGTEFYMAHLVFLVLLKIVKWIFNLKT